MNKIKELIGSITKKGWIISSIALFVIVIGFSIMVWPFSLFDFKKDKTNTVNEETEQFVQDVVNQVFTKDNVLNGEYKNDITSATMYVQNTQEVQVAVVAGKEAQEIIGNTVKVSCGKISFVTIRVPGPAVLTNTLKALFENKVTSDFTPGNIIPSYHPDLTLQNVLIENSIAKIYLQGNFSGKKDGWCDADLAIAQIVQTAKAFPNVSAVEVYQGDKKVY